MRERIKEHHSCLLLLTSPHFRSTQTKRGVFLFGASLTLLTVTLTGIQEVSMKEAIHRRLHPNNINRDSVIEIPEAWIPWIHLFA